MQLSPEPLHITQQELRLRELVKMLILLLPWVINCPWFLTHEFHVFCQHPRNCGRLTPWLASGIKLQTLFSSWERYIQKYLEETFWGIYELTSFLLQLVWLSGLSANLQTKGSPVRFPVRAHAWVAGQVPSKEHERGNAPSLSPSLLPLSLKINKLNL